MKVRISCAFAASLFALSAFFPSAHAATIGLTLTSDKDPLTVTRGDAITFTVGITPNTVITGYTLDIRYNASELSFTGSKQLVPFFGGSFVPPYLLDPADTAGDAGSSGLNTSDSGRVSVLQVNNSDPVGDLFSLSFQVTSLVADGIDDLTVGILDVRADDINPQIGGTPFTITPNSVSARIGAATNAVPVPAAAWLFGSGLLGLVGVARRQKA